MKKAQFRFYEELNDFLPTYWRKKSFDYEFSGQPSVRTLIGEIGVPQAEVDLIIVNGESVGFDYRIQAGDRVSVYPIFEAIDISAINKLRPTPLRQIKFILDVHLGRLAKYLRICGFDCYFANLDDDQIIAIALKENRIILTKDKGLLKDKSVSHGYWIRSKLPKQQLIEVICRFDLCDKIEFLIRCLQCNNKLQQISKDELKHLVNKQTQQYYDVFFICKSCQKIYWQGSHYQNMTQLIHFVQKSCAHSHNELLASREKK